MTMTLRACLEAAPYGILVRIARTHGIVVGHDVRRARVLERLLDAPLERRLRHMVAACEGAALVALQTVAVAGGCCERDAFDRLFGPIAVPREASPPAGQPGAWLAARGLIFAGPDTVILPHELLSGVPRPHDMPFTTARPSPMPIAPAAPLYDIGVILAAARQGLLTRSRRGPCLNRRTLAWLKPRMSTMDTTEQRVLFLAGLAMALGLLVPDADDRTRFAPGLAIEDWVALDAAGQMRRLWRAWLDTPSSTPPHIYHEWDANASTKPTTALDAAVNDRTLATCRSCAALRQALVHALADAPTCMSTISSSTVKSRLVAPGAKTVSLDAGRLLLAWAALPCARLGLCPAYRANDTSLIATPMRATLALLRGPLAWLDVCRLDAGHDDGGMSITADLTPLGHMLVHDAPAPPTLLQYVDIEPTAGPEGGLVVRVPSNAATDALWRLAAIARPLAGGARRWRIEADLATRWLRDADPTRLYILLENLTGRPLPEDWRVALAAFARRRAVTVTPVLLLESSDPLPSGLAHPALLTRTLSARAAVVDPARLRALRRAFARHNIPLDISDDAAGGVVPLLVSRPTRIAMAVALDLLQALDERGLPTPDATGARHGLRLSEDEATSAARAAHRLRAALDVLLDPDARPTADEDDNDGATTPEAPPRDVLEHTIARAIAEGSALHMRYAPGGHRPAAWRVIEPHRIETRYGHAYLRAYCRWRRDERLFRLDRIHACDPVPSAPRRVTERLAAQADQGRVEGIEQRATPERQLERDHE